MIWTWLKDGQPRGFFKDEHSLLISYDMIPLRGLDAARDDLNKRGKITTGSLVEDKSASLSVPFKDGVADITLIDWGCRANRYDRCLSFLCLYVSYLTYEEATHNKFGISSEQNSVIREYHWRELTDDKRRRRPLGCLKPEAEAILTSLGFQIKPVKFVEFVE